MAQMKRHAHHFDAELTIEALLTARPGAAEVLLRHGMACVGCAMARFETLAEAAREYRLDLAALAVELRLAGEDGPPRKAAP